MKSSNLERIYALSPLQEGILFHTLSAPNSATYFEQFSFTINAGIDPAALARAWQTVIDRHAILRSSFHWKQMQKPLQVVHHSVKLPFEQHDWTRFSAEERERRLRVFLANDRERGFDLSAPPLLRLMLIRLTSSSWQCVVSFHHILLDGWSVAIVFHEASACYEAYCQGREPALETPPPFEDYIAWLQKQDFGRAEAFWRKMLAGYVGPVPISGDRAPGTMPGLIEPYDYHHTTLSRDITARLQNLARKHELTVNTIVQGTWALLLSHYTDDRDVVFGATGSGRPVELKGIESMVGLFINTLPVRVQVDFDQLLIPWLRNLQAIQFQARQYEHTPLVDVQGWSSVPRGTPLFETLIGFENYPQLSTNSEVSSAVQLADVFERTNYPLSLIVSPGNELSIALLFVSSRFDHRSSARMLRQFQTLLEAITTNADRRIGELSLSDNAEQHQLLVEWNQTAQEYPRNLCVNQLFEKWVRQTPDALAVWCDREQLTYRQLNDRANKVANALRRRSVPPGSPVAICMKRTAAMVVAILGVTKLGCAYVPLDAAYPPQGLALMLHDCGARALLTTSDLVEKFPAGECDLLFMDSDEVATASNEASSALLEPEQLAYLIYTSGSTGKPRGVAVQHRSLMNLVSWHHREYAVSESDRATQIASAAFDASVWELWPYLTAGASVRVVSDATRNSPSELVKCLVSEKITLSFLPTALAEMVLELPWPEGVCLRALLTGGDKFHHTPNKALPFRVVNHYGPTENTVVTTFAVTDPNDLSPPIGRPIANVRAYVLDRNGKLAPLGTTGELCVAGDSLATAYNGLPDVTALKFVPDSFTGVSGSRLYRTGDRVRYREDGNLEFHGRLDTQV
jgi:amino acid adenylation domain-containing protein